MRWDLGSSLQAAGCDLQLQPDTGNEVCFLPAKGKVPRCLPRGQPTAFIFGGLPKPQDPPTMQMKGQDPEGKMKGQVHWQDQEGCYAGCASDSMAGGKAYGGVTPQQPFKKKDEEIEVPDEDQPAPPTRSSPNAPVRAPPPPHKHPQKVCDPYGRIRGALQGKFCQGADSCVTALPLDFGQQTQAPFCPGGNCSALAGRPWCVPTKYLELYNAPIEINCKSSGPGTRKDGHPSGCFWFLKALPREDLQRLPGIIIDRNNPEKGSRWLKRYGRGLTSEEAERWVQRGWLVDPKSYPPDPNDPNDADDPTSMTVEEHNADVARRRAEEKSHPPGAARPMPRRTPPVEMGEPPAKPVDFSANTAPTSSGIPHPKPRRGNKPNDNKQDSYENVEEGGAGRIGDEGDEEEDAVPLLAGLLGPPPHRQPGRTPTRCKRTKREAIVEFLST